MSNIRKYIHAVKHVKSLQRTCIAAENVKIWEKTCNMLTLLKYAKNAAKCQICGDRIFRVFSDMPIITKCFRNLTKN